GRQEGKPDRGRGDAQHLDDAVAALAPARQQVGNTGIALRSGHGERGAHALTPVRSSSREIASTMNEMTNSRKPSASSDDSFRLPPGLSGNSNATIEAMVLPAPNRLVAM